MRPGEDATSWGGLRNGFFDIDLDTVDEQTEILKLFATWHETQWNGPFPPRNRLHARQPRRSESYHVCEVPKFNDSGLNLTMLK